MKIITTDIPNVTKTNIDQTKVELANEIISRVQPLFEELISDQGSETESDKTLLQQKRKQVLDRKNELTTIFDKYKKEKRITILLNKIKKLVDSGLVYDAHLKNEVVVFLKMVDKASLESINRFINQIDTYIKKRF